MSASILIAPQVRGRDAQIRYEESTKGSFWFITKGVILTLLTVGIYRFWFATALRKNLWARAFIDGSPAEYTGKAHELLLGFLVALAVLLPAYIVVFVATMYSPDPALGYLFAYLLFFLLVQFARYRARRYLVSRTVWRGIRLRQDGSALHYTALAAVWWLATLATLGVAYPFMRASLERYRMNHTLLGETRFTSEADGLSVMFNWMIVYALSIIPILGCVGVLLVASNFSLPTEIFEFDTSAMIMIAIYEHFDDLLPGKSLHVIVLICVGSIISSVVLRPYYRGREARAFFNAISLNGANLNSKLSVTDIYINYFGFYLLTVLVFAFVMGILFTFGLAVSVIGLKVDPNQAVIVRVAASYAGYIFGISWLIFRFLQVGRLAVIAETLSIRGGEALDAAAASPLRIRGRLAEGVADAVDPGGIEIGF